MNDVRVAYTVTEVAKKLGIGKSTAYDLVDKGIIPSAPVVKGGRKRLVTEAMLQSYLDQLEASARRAK